MEEQEVPVKAKRGFAAMSPERQREIAAMGGKKAHELGRAHQFTTDEAREAGRVGGKKAHENGHAHQFTVEEARAAGKKGGRARSLEANAEVILSEPIHEPA